MEVPRFFVGKVGISAVNMERTLGLIIKKVYSRNSAYICVANVRTAGLSQNHKEFCRISNQSFLTVPDGMPLVWYARMGRVKGVERVPGAELMHQILSISKEREYSHYFYGSTPSVLAGMKTNLLARFEGLDIRGMVSPPFRPLTYEEKVATAKAINRARPTFVWVGLGAPKQEFLMRDMVDRLKSSIMIGVGAAFPFAAGEEKRVPRFIGKMGIEWLFRLIHNPSRTRRFIRPFLYFNVILLAQCLRRVRDKRIQLTDEEKAPIRYRKAAGPP